MNMKKNIWEHARDLNESGDLAKTTMQAGRIDPNGGMDDEFIRIAKELDVALQKLNQLRQGSQRMGDRGQELVDPRKAAAAWKQFLGTISK